MIAAIWIKRFKRGPMDAVESAELVAGRGIVGNADQGGRRQVTIIDEAAWRAACDEVGVDVPPLGRRANIMLRGIDLERTRGRMLRLGGCLIRISGEVTPCERMEEAQAGLQRALRPQWRGGVFGEVIEGGTIRVGDEASLV